MRIILLLLYLCIVSTSTLLAQEDELGWPREMDIGGIIVTLYQPQLDSFEDDVLEGRMAIAIKEDDEMIFCSAWIKARVSSDFDERIATLGKVDIPRIHFPDIDDQETIDKFSRILEEEIESWNVEMDLDRLIASMDEVEDLKTLSVQLNNDPPDIYFRTFPVTLVSIDGDPIIKEIENSGLEYVVNTAFFIVREKGKSEYYISGGKFWYTSKDIIAGWQETTSVPSDIKKLAEDNMADEEPDSISASITEAPELIVVTKPSEAITSDGDPDYQSIEGTALLYVENSETDIIMDIYTQEHYVLLAGRWFHSKTLNDGDWKFAEPEDLPDDFSLIPEDSDMATVRASVPGTPEAHDAQLAQSIPQTATVDKATAKVEVSYDGDPEFKLVDGTDVYYAANSDKQVLRINNRYYCVDDAIWFVSDNATGPWVVSDTRPDEVDELPPSSEVYNVKYVYIYDSTPEVVYVGYYPGYTYSYVYGGVVVYGTGYYYRPWYGYYYYPRAVTYGYGVHYNPYTGWGFHVGFSYGWVRWGFHPYHRHYWGARGYRHGYRHGYRRGYHHGARAGYRAGYRAGQRNANRNVYRNRSSGIKNTGKVNRAQTGRVSNNKARASNKSNNMYADKNGNVHQRNRDGSWSQKSNKKSGSSAQPSTRQSQPKSGSSVSRGSSQSSLNRSYQSRSRGSQNASRSRSSGSRSRSGGGRRR
jgi:hypothetical protein